MSNADSFTINLPGNIALVTGGYRGIGGAITEAMATAGASVTFTHTGSKQRQDVVDDLVKRQGKPEDIAGLVADMVSSWGDYICGQAILVDSGRTLFS